MKKNIIAAVLTALALPVMAVEQPIAFPGAEGYGRYVTGGRGGKVLHVTTLEDTNEEGSFRWAIGQSGARTIVFDVSGTIMLQSELKLRNPNVTIAGQSAPGDGVCIANYPFVISAQNVIIRFMRFRLGNEALKIDKNAHEGDGLGGMDTRNVIVDHCSVSWSIDECLSVYGSHDITVQWCYVSHSLVNAGHSKGAHGYGGNWGGSGASYHHNFMTNHGSRTPRLGPRPGTQTDERMDLRNNVIHNYGGNGIYGGEGMNVNIINNYFKPGKATGSGTKAMRIAKIDARTFDYCLDKSSVTNNIYKATGISGIPTSAVSGTATSDGKVYISLTKPTVQKCLVDMEKRTFIFNDGEKDHEIAFSGNSWWPMVHKYGTYFVQGNVNAKYPEVTEDNWGKGIWNQMAANECDYVYPGVNNSVKDAIPRDTPVEFVYTTTHDAATAFDRVLDYAGASLHRDEYDAMLAEEAREGTTLFTSNGLINSQDYVKYSDGSTGWPKLKSETPKADTDGDGMPDEWEKANGLDPEDPEDGNLVNEDGYTNLELYLNGLVDHIMVAGNEGGEMMNGLEATGIEDITVDNVNRPSDNRIFNLMGIEVQEPLAPGIYIRNGKKFIVR